MKKIYLFLLALVCSASMAWGTDYVLVTSTSDLENDANYLLVGATNDGYYVLGGQNSTSNRKALSTTVSNGVITITEPATSESETDKPHIIQLKSSSVADKWNFYDIAESKYLNGGYGKTNGAKSNNNTLKVSASVLTPAAGANGQDGHFSITINATTKAVTCTNQNGWTIWMNTVNSAMVFATYETGSYNAVYLYKEDQGGDDGDDATEYDITIDNNIEHGTVTASVSSAEEGATITLTATPAKGYIFDSWTVLDGDAEEITVTNNQFTMPASDVEVSATFVAKPFNPNEIIFDFNDANAYPDGFPAGKPGSSNAENSGLYTISGHEIFINASSGQYFYIINAGQDATRGLFFGKTTAANNKPTDGTAYLGFPAIPGKKLVKVVATTTAGIAGGVKMNIYDASWDAYSTQQTTVSQTKTEFTFDLSNTNGNTEYRLASGSSGSNLQFDNIVLTYEAASYTGSSINFAAQNAEGYWATYSNTKDVLIEGDALPYVVTATGTALTLNDEAFESMTVTAGSDGEVTGYFIPANTGVLLYSIETEVFMWEVDNLNLAAISASNALYPASKDKATLANHKFYKLAYGDAELTPASLGFYYGAADGAAFTSRPGSAYLAIPAGASAPAHFLFENEEQTATAIETVEANDEIVKFIENGQLIIIKNGVRYNALGQVVR